MSSKAALAVCQSGYEGLLVREMAGLGLAAAASGPGWVLAGPPSRAQDGAPAGRLRGAAFPHAILESPAGMSGGRVNELAQGIAEFFADSLRGERIEAAWPCIFAGAQDIAGLARRVAAVEAAFHGILKKKLGRIARLASAQKPRVGAVRGLFVWFTDLGTVHAARSAYMNGPSRMADDDAAPSRSYLKVEESYAIIGHEPRPGESVCDLGAAPGGGSYSAERGGGSLALLAGEPRPGESVCGLGAAPGGWSYSAAKRGARVVAVDNGRLKGGALGHPLIDHRRADAFRSEEHT